jgi:hypothetical protein
LNKSTDSDKFSINTTSKFNELNTSRKPILEAIREMYNVSNETSIRARPNQDGSLIESGRKQRKYGSIIIINSRNKTKKQFNHKQLMIKEMIKNKDKRQEIFEKMDNFLK